MPTITPLYINEVRLLNKINNFFTNILYFFIYFQSVIHPRIFQFNPKIDPVTSLSQYCTVRRVEQPDYSFVKSKFSKLFQCRVHINGSIYSTYPDEYATQQDAKTAIAEEAIKQIKMLESRRRLPICQYSDCDLVMKIYIGLESHPHGIFAKNIPEWFEKEYEQSLPERWWALVQGSKKFITEPTTNDNVIIFANNEEEKEGKLLLFTYPFEQKIYIHVLRPKSQK